MNQTYGNSLPPKKKPVKRYITWSIIGTVLIFLFLAGGCSYNGLVTEEQNVDQKWAEVEVQYQRRFDLIPNLVSTVKGYAAHESNTLEAVTNARAGLTNAYNNAKSLQDSTAALGTVPDEATFERYNQAQDRLNGAFSIYVNAVREAYPDLKANSQFLDLQTQLEGTENRIGFARQEYTKAVQTYNVKVKKFPNNLWAGIFGFSTKPQYKSEAGAQSAPKVEF